MNIFIVSVLLAAVYLTACSSHRATSRKRTSFVTRAQFQGICGEIVTLKQQNIELQNKIDQQNIELQNKIDQQNIELQNKIAYLEQSITGAVNGAWASWFTWTTCTKSCNGGIRQRQRACTNPAPVGLGRACIGQPMEIATCNDNACPASQSAFSIFGVKPTEAAPGVMTVSQEGVITNIGDDFNPATGQYTAPDNGTYVFVLNMIKDFNTALQCSIRRNDESVAIVYVPYSADYHMGSASAVLSLKQGDIVDVGNCTDIDAIISWTSFIGFKLEVDQSDPN